MARATDIRPVVKLRSTAGTGYTYVTRKNKTNSRKRWGHRQQYATIEITGITKG